MNARQYFYRNVLPQKVGLSYQKAMRIDMSGESNQRQVMKIIKHIPKCSNDRHLEGVIKDLLDHHLPVRFRDRLEYLFVAKLRSHDYQAVAIIKPGEYRGDLVYYYVGLADALYEFSIFFTEFIQRKTDTVTLLDHGIRLAIMSQDWKSRRPLIIDLDPNLIVQSSDDLLMQKAASIATLTDKFIICHEIAHHLLGHTGKRDEATSLLELLPDELKSWRSQSEGRAKELQADAVATLFLMRLTEDSMVQGALGNSQEAFEAIVGCLLVLSVSRFLSEDPNEFSVNYPSDNERLESCTAILSYYTDPAFLDSTNAKLSQMFAVLALLGRFADMNEKGATPRELKSINGIIHMLLEQR